MQNQYYFYLLTNKYKNLLYAGVTNDLTRRVYEHKHKLQKGFTQKYNIDCLVYYEIYNDVEYAIAREKEIKGWRRDKKNELINRINPEWRDLYSLIK